VDKPDPYPDRVQGGEAEEAVGGLVVAGSDAAVVLQAVDEALDAAAEVVEGAADAVLNMAVPLGRDLRHGAAVAQILSYRVTVVALVAEHDGGVAVAGLHQRVVVRAVGLLPGCHV